MFGVFIRQRKQKCRSFQHACRRTNGWMDLQPLCRFVLLLTSNLKELSRVESYVDGVGNKKCHSSQWQSRKRVPEELNNQVSFSTSTSASTSVFLYPSGIKLFIFGLLPEEMKFTFRLCN